MVSVFIWIFICFFLLFQESFQTQKPGTLKCECGKLDDFTFRILGGRNAEPGQHPWMVVILHHGRTHCGGTLINDRYVLTAGHCIRFARLKYLSVMLPESEYKAVKIQEIENAFAHENFSSNELHDFKDIGLIKLKHPVEFNSDIKPICLPNNDDDYAGETATVIGMGKTSEEGEETSQVLKEATVTVLRHEDCRENPEIGDKILDTFLCAYEDYADACQGDSGGPLIYKSKTGKMEQIGIVSWGLGCAQLNVPGVYTRITSYLKWIQSHTKDANYCKIPE